MDFKPATDGAGQEILAQLSQTEAALNGDEISTVNSSEYTDKSWFTEDTGRSLAAAIATINSIIATHVTKLNGIDEGANKYTLPTATASVLGGVMLGSDTVQTVAANAVTTTSSRTYAVQVNSDGQLVVNVPWSNTDTNTYVTQTLTTTNAEYPLLARSTTATTTSTTSARFASGVTLNPYTNTITATTFAGNASTASKVNNALTVTLNGTPYAYDGSSAKSFSFYAPTSAGTADYVLKSNGSGSAPSWVQLSTLTTDYVLPKATTSALGGILAAAVRTTTTTLTTGGTTSDRYFGVELDANGVAFVNIPATVTQTSSTTGTGSYPLLASANTASATSRTVGTIYNSAVYLQPSTGTVYATAFNGNLTGNATTATKLGTDAGSAAKPVYFSNGIPVACAAIFAYDAVAIGNDADYGDASYSVAIGCNAYATDRCVAVGLEASGSGYLSAAIGPRSSASANYSVALGYGATAAYAQSTAIGYNATTTATYQIQLGGSSNSYVYYYGTLSSRSDERDKADIEDFNDDTSLEFITSLRTFTYVRNPRGAYEYTTKDDKGNEIYSEYHNKYGLGLYDVDAHASGTKKGSRKRSGVSAQDIQEKMQEYFGNTDLSLVNDSLYDRTKAGEEIPDGIESQLDVSYVSLIPILISAMRAQQNQIESLKEQIENLSK